MHASTAICDHERVHLLLMPVQYVYLTIVSESMYCTDIIIHVSNIITQMSIECSYIITTLYMQHMQFEYMGTTVKPPIVDPPRKGHCIINLSTEDSSWDLFPYSSNTI